MNSCLGCIQAAKPKGASGSEKENNPVRTPEALPEAKKAEYRQLKEEIARYQTHVLETLWKCSRCFKD